MKKFSKIRSVALLVALVLSLGVANAFADQDAGSITVTNAEIGKEYALYKLFDATVAPDGSIAYSLPTGKSVENDTFFDTYFQIVNGNIIKKDAFTTDVLKEDAFKAWAIGTPASDGVPAVPGFGTLVSAQTASTDSVTWSPIDYGYYFVTSTVGAVITVDSANPSASVIDKNQTVKFDKTIVTMENGAEKLVKANEAGLDITVPFDITVNAKNYDGEQKIFKYVIKDTMDPGFTITSVPVVKVGDTTLAAEKYTITYKNKDGATVTDLTNNIAAVKSFEIVIPWTSDGTKDGTFLYGANDKINVRYSAKLDPNKASEVKVGENNPNLNEAEVDYFKGNDSPDTPSGNLGKKYTKTFETKLTIIKKDGQNNVLTGAQFTLTSTNGTKVSYVYEKKYVADAAGTYYLLKDGTYTAEAPNDDATHNSVYADTQTKYKLVEEAKVMGENQTPSTISSYVGDDGTVTFSGLGTGKYKIEETVVPAGYNKAADIEFTIAFTLTNATEESASGTFSCTDNPNVVLNSTTHAFETTVINNKGTELPSTGGIGTTIFYVVGGVLVLAAIILLVTKKRMSD